MGYEARLIEPLIPQPFLDLVVGYKLSKLPPRTAINVMELTEEDCEAAWEYRVGLDRERE